MLKDIYKPTKYFEPYQPNPTGKTCGDCSIRCIAVAMDKTWEEAFDLLSAKAREMYYEMSEPAVVSEVLKENGFTEMKVFGGKGQEKTDNGGTDKGEPRQDDCWTGGTPLVSIKGWQGKGFVEFFRKTTVQILGEVNQGDTKSPFMVR